MMKVIEGMMRLGSSFSVVDFISFAYSMSFRIFARIGSTVAVFGMRRLGSASGSSCGPALPWRSTVRPGSARRWRSSTSSISAAR